MPFSETFQNFEQFETNLNRLDLRHRFCVENVKAEFRGKRVLDIASHDGKWAYAYAEAGAAEVVGIEGRAELVEEFGHFPEHAFKKRVHLNVGDAVTFLEDQVAAGETYDFVSLLGFFYHTLEHYKIIYLISHLNARFVVVDSEFITAVSPMIQLVIESTGKISNAIPKFDGQDEDVVGIPSVPAMERLATVFGYRCDWVPWDDVPVAERQGLGDYFRDGRKRRRTCYLSRP